MKKRHRCLGVALGGFVSCLAAVVGLPMLIVGSATGSSDLTAACGLGALPSLTDGTPSILGPTTLTYAELITWWDDNGRDQPSPLAAPVSDVIALYLSEGDADGVRGDIALAQAILETGHFSSSDTSINNFAGIGHSEGSPSGHPFPTPSEGVRAHIQLLKKYAAGNDVDLIHPDVAPDAGAAARSWGELAGTWATASDYWTSIATIYDAMLTHAGREAASTATSAPTSCEPVPTAGTEVAEGSLTDVRGIVVHASIADHLDDLLAAATADGLTLTGGGYRSHARQIELRRAHCGTSQYAIYEMPAGQCSPPTARPGTSRHEQGLAIDFNNCSTRATPCYQWLATNAAPFGFHNLPSEPWHWSIDGS